MIVSVKFRINLADNFMFLIAGSDMEDPVKNKLLTYIYRNNRSLWQRLQTAGII